MPTNAMTQTLQAAGLTWEQSRNGFHRRQHQSNQTVIRDEEENGCFFERRIEFIVSEYTSDREDFFGVNVNAWAIVVRTYNATETDPEPQIFSTALIGDDYSREEDVKEFAELALQTWLKHGDFRVLPQFEYDVDSYFL